MSGGSEALDDAAMALTRSIRITDLPSEVLISIFKIVISTPNVSKELAQEAFPKPDSSQAHQPAHFHAGSAPHAPDIFGILPVSKVNRLFRSLCNEKPLWKRVALKVSARSLEEDLKSELRKTSQTVTGCCLHGSLPRNWVAPRRLTERSLQHLVGVHGRKIEAFKLEVVYTEKDGIERNANGRNSQQSQQDADPRRFLLLAAAESADAFEELYAARGAADNSKYNEVELVSWTVPKWKGILEQLPNLKDLTLSRRFAKPPGKDADDVTGSGQPQTTSGILPIGTTFLRLLTIHCTNLESLVLVNPWTAWPVAEVGFMRVVAGPRSENIVQLLTGFQESVASNDEEEMKKAKRRKNKGNLKEIKDSSSEETPLTNGDTLINTEPQPLKKLNYLYLQDDQGVHIPTAWNDVFRIFARYCPNLKYFDIGGEHVLPDPLHSNDAESEDPGINAPRQMPILFPKMDDWVKFCQYCVDIESMDFGLLGSISDDHLRVFSEISDEELAEVDASEDEEPQEVMQTDMSPNEARPSDTEMPLRPKRALRSRSPSSKIRVHENLTTIDLTPRNSSDMFFGHNGAMGAPEGDMEDDQEGPFGTAPNETQVPGPPQQASGIFPMLANFIGGGFGFGGGTFFAENGNAHSHNHDHSHHDLVHNHVHDHEHDHMDPDGDQDLQDVMGPDEVSTWSYSMDSVMQLLSSAPNLQELSIADSANGFGGSMDDPMDMWGSDGEDYWSGSRVLISDSLLEHLSETNRKLVTLQVWSNGLVIHNNITDSGFESLASLPHLEEVSLNEVPNITHRGIAEFLLSPRPSSISEASNTPSSSKGPRSRPAQHRRVTVFGRGDKIELTGLVEELVSRWSRSERNPTVDGWPWRDIPRTLIVMRLWDCDLEPLEHARRLGISLEPGAETERKAPTDPSMRWMVERLVGWPGRAEADALVAKIQDVFQGVKLEVRVELRWNTTPAPGWVLHIDGAGKNTHEIRSEQ
ncbi:hypothetical protein M427DRAFT_73854 [Gonapodya prolifera JEL478]|uniref:F-box domain-containing protein n=1 Tax=Gonapodya prolifera (strain JEL478) TaxID=1344416 RepID=A0A139A1G4_GONPJ|nr:hypothetical protein M427DRAFT_73854 [Gonapodya prolifera JEL478]|eukprot:KXS10581.1 hypothetical protein M427DRAFT_73854 [Gonapodya prolifera JEL478]